MKCAFAILATVLLLTGCQKEENDNPQPAPAPTTRSVRYEVTCAGSYYFAVRLNGEGGTLPSHSGDTSATLQLEPGTVIQVLASLATADISGKLFVDGVLRDELNAPASMGITLQDTIP